MQSKQFISRIQYLMFLTLFYLCMPHSMIFAAEDLSVNTIQNKGEIQVGVDIPYGVMEFYDESGKPTGIDIDIAKEISKDLGVVAKFHIMPFAQLFDALKSGDVDVVISAVTITRERQKSMNFSSPYMDVGLSLSVAATNQQIASMKDLKSSRVGVLRGTTGEKYANENLDTSTTKIILFDNNEARLSALRSGEIDAAIVHFLSGDIPGIKVVGKPLTQSYYGVVGRLEDKKLMNKINSVLRDLKNSGRLEAIKGKYVN